MREINETTPTGTWWTLKHPHVFCTHVARLVSITGSQAVFQCGADRVTLTNPVMLGRIWMPFESRRGLLAAWSRRYPTAARNLSWALADVQAWWHLYRTRTEGVRLRDAWPHA